MELLEYNDTLSILKQAVTYQVQKMQNAEKTEGGKEWRQYFPDIVRTKFEDYLKDYEKLSLVLQEEQNTLHDKMNEGYYYWRLLRSACNTYQNDLQEYDTELFQEFGLKKTKAISDNDVLKKCISVLEKHAVED